MNAVIFLAPPALTYHYLKGYFHQTVFFNWYTWYNPVYHVHQVVLDTGNPLVPIFYMGKYLSSYLKRQDWKLLLYLYFLNGKV